jgi:hypothetical protein
MSYAAVNAWCETLVWVLTHSLWLGTIAAGAVWVALRSLPARQADFRYRVAVLGLAAVVLSSLVTWSVLRLERVPVTPSVSGPVSHGKASPPPATGGEQVRRDLANSSDARGDPMAMPVEADAMPAWVVWVAVVWGLGAGVMITRGVAGLARAHALAWMNAAVSSSDVGERPVPAARHAATRGR